MKFSKETVQPNTHRIQPDDYLTLDQVAGNLQVSKRYVQSLVKRKVIPVIRIGRRCTRFDMTKVRVAIERFEIEEYGRK